MRVPPGSETAACAHVFLAPHLPSWLSSDHDPRWVGGRVVCPPQSNSQDEAHGADCLAAKEVLRPVVLPHPSLHPPSGAPQMPRYSKCSCAHKPLPVDGTGGRRSDKHCPTLVSKLSCRSAPLHRSLYSLFFLSLSLSLCSTHSFAPNWIKKEMWQGTRGREGSPVWKNCVDSGRAGTERWMPFIMNSWRPRVAAHICLTHVCVYERVCVVFYYIFPFFLPTLPVETPLSHSWLISSLQYSLMETAVIHGTLTNLVGILIFFFPPHFLPIAAISQKMTNGWLNGASVSDEM